MSWYRAILDEYHGNKWTDLENTRADLALPLIFVY